MLQTTLITRDTPLPAGWRYSVMRKLAMAVSGLVLVAFLFGHWAGNTRQVPGPRAR